MKEVSNGPIKPGDFVVFQHFADEDENGMKTVKISLLKVIEVDEENKLFLPDNSNIKQPMYRIRHHIVKGRESKPYTGYSQLCIMRDEGVITDDTFNEIEALESTQKGINNE